MILLSGGLVQGSVRPHFWRSAKETHSNKQVDLHFTLCLWAPQTEGRGKKKEQTQNNHGVPRSNQNVVATDAKGARHPHLAALPRSESMHPPELGHSARAAGSPALRQVEQGEFIRI